jgi:protein disulfide isomerase
MEASMTPSIRLLSPGEEMRKFAYEGDINSFTTESLKAFIDDVTSGKLKAHLKSEPIPENSGPLTVLVGDNWADIVMDTNKDVLVKYYAPWCGHCKKLAPIWDELAESVKDMDNLVIAKFDATLNEVDGLAIRGYPTLKWYPKGDKSGQDYDGGRELPDFVKFLAESSDVYKATKSSHDEL